MKQLRRFQSELINSGTAVIAFSGWTVIKSAILLILYRRDMIPELDFPGADGTFVFMIYLFIFVNIAIDFLLRLFIGLSARAEGSDKGCSKIRSYVYLAIAALVLLLSANSMVSTLLFRSEYDFSSFMTIVIELTSLGAMITLFVCSIRVKMLRKELLCR